MLPDDLTAEMLLGHDSAEIRCVADITAEEVRWLWPGRIPIGKLSMLSGDPGLGKSLISLYIAATVSCGNELPCSEGPAPNGDVILISAEDDPADTIRPRLEAAGACLERIHILERISSMDEDGQVHTRPWNFMDIPALDERLRLMPACTLVIVDPIGAYLGGTDSHKNADVRALLAPLSELAARHHVAILCVSHLNKSCGPAIYRTTGSLAFIASARSAYTVAKDKNDPTRRLMVPIKNNLAPDSSGLAYRVTATGKGVPFVSWEPETVDITADEALCQATPDEHSSALQEATEWLESYLSDGPKPVLDVLRDGKGTGLKEITIRRAKNALGIRPTKSRFHGGWVWELPSKMLNNSEDAHV